MASLQTEPDAWRFRETSVTSHIKDVKDTVKDVKRPLASKHDDTMYYDMSGNKILVIFNHYKFKKTRHYKIIVPESRDGTYQDVKSLEKTFRRRGFAVITHDDWTYKDIMEYLSYLCNMDHSLTSCVAIAVMTHGHGGEVCASDRMYRVTRITDQLRTAPNLAGKPKLFFIQACRAGHTKPPTLRDAEVMIPLDADCLLIYSSYEDYVSYRDVNETNPLSPTNGSWLMKALCEVIDTRHGSMDLVGMVHLINNTVAAKCSKVGDKQMPVTEFQLTKLLNL